MWAVLRMWRPWDRKHVPPDCTHRNPAPLPAEHLRPTSTSQSKFPGSSPPSLGQRGGPSSVRPGTRARRDSSSVEDLLVPQILEGVSSGAARASKQATLHPGGVPCPRPKRGHLLGKDAGQLILGHPAHGFTKAPKPKPVERTDAGAPHSGTWPLKCGGIPAKPSHADVLSGNPEGLQIP